MDLKYEIKSQLHPVSLDNNPEPHNHCWHCCDNDMAHNCYWQGALIEETHSCSIVIDLEIEGYHCGIVSIAIDYDPRAALSTMFHIIRSASVHVKYFNLCAYYTTMTLLCILLIKILIYFKCQLVRQMHRVPSVLYDVCLIRHVRCVIAKWFHGPFVGSLANTTFKIPLFIFLLILRSRGFDLILSYFWHVLVFHLATCMLNARKKITNKPLCIVYWQFWCICFL